MLSLEEDLEKIKELENTILTNDNNFKELLEKYNNNINKLRIKISELQYYSKIIYIIILLSHKYDNIITECIFITLSSFLAYNLW
jgi:hypothetical protein